MNKLLKYGIATALLFGATSCYDDVVRENSFSGVYFSKQQPLRTALADRDGLAECNSIKVGVTIAGKLEVDLNDWAIFEIDESLFTNTDLYPSGTGLVPMPKEYYNLSHESLMSVTKANNFLAEVEVSFTDKFFDDPKAIDAHYAIPFSLIESSCDSIISTKYYSMVAVKYQSKYHGTYYVQGYTASLDGAGEITAIKRYSEPNLSKNETREIATVSRRKVSRLGQSLTLNNEQVDNGSVYVEVSESGEVSVTAAAGNTTFVEGSGDLTYDDQSEKCVINIDYKFKSNGVTYVVEEKLTRRQDPMMDLRVEMWKTPDAK